MGNSSMGKIVDAGGVMKVEGDPESFRITVRIAVHLALRDTPWTLLTGAEKGRRHRDAEEERTRRLADLIVDRLLLGVCFTPAAPVGPPPSETQARSPRPK